MTVETEESGIEAVMARMMLLGIDNIEVQDPEDIRQIMDIAPYYSKLLQVRPGITSWGMVKYGYASTVFQMVERMRYDLMYINNCSIAVDLKILGFTVRTVLTGKGI